ncbi:MAG: winged helix-turn-helix domain-containing protein [Halobacteriota archaeon]
MDRDATIIDYLEQHGKTGAGELAILTGITVSSVRYRLFKLVAKGIVTQEKARNYRVWFSIAENEKGARRAISRNHTKQRVDTALRRDQHNKPSFRL